MPFILFNFAYFSQICDEKNPQNDRYQVLIGIRKMQIVRDTSQMLYKWTENKSMKMSHARQSS